MLTKPLTELTAMRIAPAAEATDELVARWTRRSCS